VPVLGVVSGLALGTACSVLAAADAGAAGALAAAWAPVETGACPGAFATAGCAAVGADRFAANGMPMAGAMTVPGTLGAAGDGRGPADRVLLECSVTAAALLAAATICGSGAADVEVRVFGAFHATL
jgi:hypothetical protein